MEKIFIVCGPNSPRMEAIREKISREYEIIEGHDMMEADSFVQREFDHLACLIIDTPSTKQDIGYLLEYIKSRNNFMFNLPVLILTDTENIDNDVLFLNPPVVDVLFSNDSERLILRRISNAIKAANSTSFDDFSDKLKVLPSLLYLKDREGRYAFCSQHWHHVYKDQSIRGLTDFDIRKDKKNAAIARQSDLEVVETGKGKRYIIKEEDEEGTDYLQIIKEPLKDENDEVYGIIAIINNVTDSELLKQELRIKSITDALTGLYNRVYFDEFIRSDNKDLEFPVTIISADCDGLKDINDKFGHTAGDQYINYARDALKRGLPKRSTLFRMGGDEFLAIVPHTTKVQAKKIVEKIEKAVPLFKNKRFALELSIGSFTLNSNKTTFENAIVLSDEDMYRNKKEHKKKQK